MDQDGGRAELWRLSGGEYARVPEPLRSEVTGLVYVQGPEALEIRDSATGRTWRV